MGDRLVDPSLTRGLAPQQPGKAPATQTQNPTSQARAPQVGAPKIAPPQAQANQDGVVDEAALAEAKKMLWDKSHPFHGALHDAGHFQHGYAVERYAGLFRKAYGEEAGEGQSGRAEASSGQPHAKPVEATRVSTKQRETDGARGDEAIHGDHGDDASIAPGRTQLAQTEDEAQDEDTRSDDELRAEDPEALFARDRERGEAQAAQRRREEADRVRQETDRDHMIGTRPPSWAPPQTDTLSTSDYAAAIGYLASLQNFSDYERHAYLRLLSYEGMGVVDAAKSEDRSKGGVLQSTLDSLRDVVNTARQGDGDENQLPRLVDHLTIADVIDVMKAYTTRETVGQREFSADDLGRPLHELADLGSIELSAQFVDILYRYGSRDRANILQDAINRTVAQIRPDRRRQLGLSFVANDSILGSVTREMVRRLAEYEFTAGWLAQNLKLTRAEHAVRELQYGGADRMRIWGLSELQR